jgi:hypothetical protein
MYSIAPAEGADRDMAYSNGAINEQGGRVTRSARLLGPGDQEENQRQVFYLRRASDAPSEYWEFQMTSILEKTTGLGRH